jgi:hypothetical protein
MGKVVAAAMGVEAAPTATGLDKMGKYLSGELRQVGKKDKEPQGRTFAEAAEIWRREYKILTAGERSPAYVKLMFERLDKHVLPYFGKKDVTKIIRATTKDYLIHRVAPHDRQQRKGHFGPPYRRAVEACQVNAQPRNGRCPACDGNCQWRGMASISSKAFVSV